MHPAPADLHVRRRGSRRAPCMQNTCKKIHQGGHDDETRTTFDAAAGSVSRMSTRRSVRVLLVLATCARSEVYGAFLQSPQSLLHRKPLPAWLGKATLKSRGASRVILNCRPADIDDDSEPALDKPKRGLPKRKGKAKRSERIKPGSGKGFGTVGGLNFDRRPKPDALCACSSGSTYAECCKPIHDGLPAGDPISLLRSRYTAYCYRLPDYLMQTTSATGSEWQEDGVSWKKEILGFCDKFVFEGLTIESEAAFVDDNKAAVTFKTQIVEKGSIKMMDVCETSMFVRADAGPWLYHEGNVGYTASDA
eukprot:2063968-Pleurochrysis_carterae.AAC.1